MGGQVDAQESKILQLESRIKQQDQQIGRQDRRIGVLEENVNKAAAAKKQETAAGVTWASSIYFGQKH